MVDIVVVSGMLLVSVYYYFFNCMVVMVEFYWYFFSKFMEWFKDVLVMVKIVQDILWVIDVIIDGYFEMFKDELVFQDLFNVIQVDKEMFDFDIV